MDVRPSPQVDEAFARVGPDTVGERSCSRRIDGAAKGVINTQRMMCANQESAAAAWSFLENHPPVLCDWLP